MKHGERLRHEWRSLPLLTRLRIIWLLASYHYGDYICATMVALSVAIYVHARTIGLVHGFPALALIVFGSLLSLSLNLYRIRNNHFKPLISWVCTLSGMIVGAYVQDELIAALVAPFFATLVAIFAAGYTSTLVAIFTRIVLGRRFEQIITD